MKTSLECIPCFLRQTLEAGLLVTQDTSVHEEIVRYVLRMTAEMDLSLSPPVMGQAIHRKLREMTGVDDPYLTVKNEYNRLALGMLPELTAQVRQAANPLLAAARLAITANMIDLGVAGSISEREVSDAITRSLSEPIVGNWAAFEEAVSSSKRILFLADNAGEIVFDQLLIRELGLERVVVAVRGRAVLNDATRDDAMSTGLHELVEIVDNGSDAPGTVLSDCSQAFRKRFAEAELIIAKGQGNFETLSEVDANIFFLLKVKCPVIVSHVGLATSTHALIHSSEIS